MKEIEVGHIYELENKIKGKQIIKFFKDLPKSEEGHDGILCQELFRCLIARYFELYKQQPCIETHQILIGLRELLILAETRAARLTLSKAYAKTGQNVEDLPVSNNGHIFNL